MNRYFVLTAVIAAAALVSCATPEPQQTSQTHEKSDKTYTTGSRIPVRDGGGSGYVNSVDSKEGVGDMMQKKDVYIGPKGGPN